MLNGIRIRMTDRKESVNETLIGRSDIPAAFVQQLLYTVRSSHLTKAANSSVSLFDGEREHDRTFSITAVGPADLDKQGVLWYNIMVSELRSRGGASGRRGKSGHHRAG